jgi:hypothetical protein
MDISIARPYRDLLLSIKLIVVIFLAQPHQVKQFSADSWRFERIGGIPRARVGPYGRAIQRIARPCGWHDTCWPLPCSLCVWCGLPGWLGDESSCRRSRLSGGNEPEEEKGHRAWRPHARDSETVDCLKARPKRAFRPRQRRTPARSPHRRNGARDEATRPRPGTARRTAPRPYRRRRSTSGCTAQ